MGTKTKTLDVAKAELDDAVEHFKTAEHEAHVASTNKVQAMNQLNDKQRQFDAVVEAIKDKAPAASDWKTVTHGE